jgi:DNA-binding LacI/PurR family transcriptional regulator
MTIRLKDVAEKASVSLATASRVLKADKMISVSADTRERIWKAAQELGYTPKNSTGKAKKNAKNVGYILQMTKDQFEDPFFSKIIYGVEKEINQQRMNLAFSYTAIELQDPEIFHNIKYSNVDGLIFIGNIPEHQISTLVDKIPYCVSTTFNVPGHLQMDCVSIDYEPNIYKLVRDLIIKGHRDIAFIGGSTYFLSPEDIEEGFFYNHDPRYQGYLKALFEKGITPRQEIIKDGKWEIETAYHRMNEILDSSVNITAAITASDRMAFGAMRAIQERGMKIPEDISIAGFDDLEMSRFVTPTLTTIGYPMEDIGVIAVKLLAERIKSGVKDYTPNKILLPTHIIHRDSTNLR